MEFFKSFLMAFLGACAGALATYLIALPKKYRANSKMLDERLSKTENGIKSLLRNELQKEYLKICNPNRKWAKPYEKQNISESYQAYKDLGGNSYIDELYEQMMHKPVEPEYYNKERKDENVNG